MLTLALRQAQGRQGRRARREDPGFWNKIDTTTGFAVSPDHGLLCVLCDLCGKNQRFYRNCALPPDKSLPVRPSAPSAVNLNRFYQNREKPWGRVPPSYVLR